VWVGLTLSYVFPALPPSSMVIAVAVGIYVVALFATALRDPRAALQRLANLGAPTEAAHEH